MACEPKQILALAKCFQCLDHKQLEMVKSYLLCQIANTPAVSPPVLAFSFPNLTWTFSGTDPNHWSVQGSDDFGVTWTEVSTSPGSDRSAQFLDSGVLARIVGENALNSPIIPPSNSVTVE